MCKNKNFLKIVGLVLLMVANATRAMETGIETAGNQLWKILHETELDQPIDGKDLEEYAGQVQELIEKKPVLLKKKRCGKTPQFFAVGRCYYEIAALFNSACSKKTKIKGYQLRSEEDRARTSKWAESYAKTAALQLVGIVKKAMGAEDAELEMDKTPDFSHENFDWKISRTNTELSRTFTCRVCQHNTGVLVGKIKFTGIGPDKELEVTIDQLKVAKKFRQQGLGRALLLTVIDITTLLGCEKVEISLEAEPDNEAMLPILINYYKSFGFIPESTQSEYLKLYIDKNGKILKKYELKKTE